MNAAALETTPTTAQQRAFSFVSARIAEADGKPFHGGYIHGLIQALTMANAITLKQGTELEQMQERASCNALNRRSVTHAPRQAAGGAA